MKRLWPEIAVALLGLLFAGFALAGDCPCVDCKCADCPCVAVGFTSDKPRDYPLEGDVWDKPDGTTWQMQRVCSGQSCTFQWVKVKHKPAPPVAVPANVCPTCPAVQTAEPPLAVEGRRPVRTVVAVVWQKLRVVFHLRGRRGCASCGG